MSHHDIAKSLGVPRSTVSSVLKRFRDRLTLERKPGSGGKRNDSFKSQRNAVLRLVKQNPNLSIRDIAKKVKKSYSFVQKVKKAAGYRSYKVIKAPNRNEKQETSSRTRARKLYDTLLTKFDCVVMDECQSRLQAASWSRVLYRITTWQGRRTFQGQKVVEVL